MEEEYLKFIAMRKGIEVAYELMAQNNSPVDFREVERVERETLDRIAKSHYTLTEREYMLEGARYYFLDYKSIIREAFVDVV